METETRTNGSVRTEWVQCRFCEYAVKRWFMAEMEVEGRKFEVLRFHLKDRHPEEYRLIQSKLDREATREHADTAR